MSGAPRLAGAFGLLLALAVLPQSVRAQEAAGDSLLVEVTLAGGESILVLAAPDGNGSLVLPAAEIYALAGLSAPPMPWIRLAEVGELLQVSVVYSPRQMRVTLTDTRGVLPASRERLDRLRNAAMARNNAAFTGGRGGLFGGVTVDDRREALLDLGYAGSLIQVRGSHSTVSGTAFAAAVTPARPLWLTWSHSPVLGSRIGARLALSRLWVAAEHHDGRVGVQGSAQAGPLIVYASSRDRFAVTWRGDVDVQLGHAGDRSSLRVSFGPIDPSPLSVPLVY